MTLNLSALPKYRANKRSEAAVKNGAVIYVRVSTKEQKENLSLSTQMAKCLEFCQSNGLEVHRTFSEAESAKGMKKRSELIELLAYCEANYHQIAAVVCFDVSRLSRETTDYYLVKARLKLKDIEIRSVQGFGTDPAGEFTEGILVLAAQFDNRQKAQKTINGMQSAMGLGRWLHCPPIGYLNCREAPGYLVLDEARAPSVIRAFEMFAEGYSKAEIRRSFLASGLTMPGSGKPPSAQHVDKLLRMPIYCGMMVSPRWGLQQRGAFPPLISEALFNRCQETMVNNTARKTRSVPEAGAFPLRHFARCGVCGHLLTGSKSTSKSKKSYAFYHCYRCKKGGVRMRAEVLHQKFIEALYSLDPNNKYMELFRRVLEEVWKTRNAERLAEHAANLKKKEALEGRKQKFIELLADGTLSTTDYQAQMLRLGTQLETLDLELNLKSDSRQELLNLLEFAEWLLQRIAGLWNAAILANKLRLQEVLFPDGIVVKNGAIGTPKHPLFFDSYMNNDGGAIDLASPEGFEPSLPP